MTKRRYKELFRFLYDYARSRGWRLNRILDIKKAHPKITSQYNAFPKDACHASCAPERRLVKYYVCNNYNHGIIWTLAHEIGHIILDIKEDSWRSWPQLYTEKMAWNYAIKLLGKIGLTKDEKRLYYNERRKSIRTYEYVANNQTYMGQKDGEIPSGYRDVHQGQDSNNLCPQPTQMS